MCSFAELHVPCRRGIVAVEVTFIYDTLQNRTATLLTSKCVFSPFLNCPVGTSYQGAGVRTEDCFVVVVLLQKRFCCQVMTGSVMQMMQREWGKSTNTCDSIIKRED